MCTRTSSPSRCRVEQGAGGRRERQVICYCGSWAEFWSLGPPEAAGSHLSFLFHMPIQGLENKCLLVGDSISGLGEGGQNTEEAFPWAVSGPGPHPCPQTGPGGEVSRERPHRNPFPASELIGGVL